MQLKINTFVCIHTQTLANLYPKHNVELYLLTAFIFHPSLMNYLTTLPPSFSHPLFIPSHIYDLCLPYFPSYNMAPLLCAQTHTHPNQRYRSKKNSMLPGEREQKIEKRPLLRLNLIFNPSFSLALSRLLQKR